MIEWKVGDLAVVRGGGEWTMVQFLEVKDNHLVVREVLTPWVYNGFGTVFPEELEVPSEEEMAHYLTQEITR